MTYSQVCSSVHHYCSRHKQSWSCTESPCSSELLPGCMCTSGHSVLSAKNLQPVTHSVNTDHSSFAVLQMCAFSGWYTQIPNKKNMDHFFNELKLILQLTSWYSPLLSTHPQFDSGTHLPSLRTKPALHWQPSTQPFGGRGQKMGKRSAQVGGHGGVQSE